MTMTYDDAYDNTNNNNVFSGHPPSFPYKLEVRFPQKARQKDVRVAGSEDTEPLWSGELFNQKTKRHHGGLFLCR